MISSHPGQPPAGARYCAADREGFLMSSPYRSLRTTGCQEVVTLPATGGAQFTSAFQVHVRAAFARARAAGVERPIIVGAIPFDTRQPSMLFIPRRYQLLDRALMLSNAGAAAPFEAPAVLAVHERADAQGYQSAVASATYDIKAGQLDKVVLGRQLLLDIAHRPDVDLLMARLMDQNPDSYHFSVPLPQGTLVGASPELLLRKHAATLWTTPLAGTAPRSHDADEDHQLAQALKYSAKDLYEHRVVTQAIQRQLTPVTRDLAVPSSPDVMPTARLWHLGSPIHATVASADETSLSLACRLHPTPALRGFPEAEASQRIALLEPEDRGPFGGIVGWCDDQGNGEWVVAIRCAVVGERCIRLFAGAGIVADSDPASEWRETANKLGTMLNAFGLDASLSAQVAAVNTAAASREHPIL